MSLAIKPMNTLDSTIGMLREEIKKERSQTNVNYSKIAMLLFEQADIQQLSCYNTFREQSFKLRERAAALMTQIQASYADTTVKKMQEGIGGTTIAAGVLSAMSGGLGAFIPGDAATVLSTAQEAAKYCQTTFSALGGVSSAGAQGVGHFNEIKKSEQEAIRQELSFIKDEEKKLEDEASRDADAADRQRQKHEDAIKELENSKTSTFKAIANG